MKNSEREELRNKLSTYTDKVVKAVNEGYSLAIADADGFLKFIDKYVEERERVARIDENMNTLKNYVEHPMVISDELTKANPETAYIQEGRSSANNFIRSRLNIRIVELQSKENK